MDLWCISCLGNGEMLQAVTVIGGNAMCVRHVAAEMATPEHGAVMPQEQWHDVLKSTLRTTERHDPLGNLMVPRDWS